MNQTIDPSQSPLPIVIESTGFDIAVRTRQRHQESPSYTVGTGGTLSASPNATYTYDSAGHLTAKTDTSTGKVTTFAYDHRDRLTGITRKTSGGTVDYRTTYVYDALNRRIAEQVDADGAGAGSPVTTWTVFDGVNPYADFDGAGSLQTRYLYSLAVDEILGRTDSSGDTYWYMTDGLGSVRDIFDEWGTSVYHTGYDSFGNKVSTTGSGGDRFGFTGREHDAALNLYYYRARFYDPATGRFLSKDPIGFEAGDTNLYRYVGNGPQNAVDPSGLKKADYVTDIDDAYYRNKIDPIVLKIFRDRGDNVLRRAGGRRSKIKTEVTSSNGGAGPRGGGQQGGGTTPVFGNPVQNPILIIDSEHTKPEVGSGVAKGEGARAYIDKPKMAPINGAKVRVDSPSQVGQRGAQIGRFPEKVGSPNPGITNPGSMNGKG